jgi:hypothetical protein
VGFLFVGLWHTSAPLAALKNVPRLFYFLITNCFSTLLTNLTKCHEEKNYKKED